jgi:uncharacterized protein (DUF983 family)
MSLSPPNPSPVPVKRGLIRQVGETVWAILRHRCPRCRQGKMFRGLFTMNDPCPVCGLLFQREEGTFLGAMYVSYVLAGLLMAALYFPLEAALPDWNGITLTTVVMLVFLPFTPLLFRYSRTLWIYFERAGSPSGASATAYEKMRLKQLENPRNDTEKN